MWLGQRFIAKVVLVFDFYSILVDSVTVKFH